ncbi:MAG: hypothetical protein K1000chlam3_01385 [Chlamydiae bacterium]|nr:hypothetical protein [Chlamydiota bacterium]
MPNAVTIDNYDVEIHERYATDQAGFDEKILLDTSEISSHFSIAADESRLLLKWEELFETHLHRHPFAWFSPPPFYTMMRNRFFTHVISPDFDWIKKEAEEGEERKEENQQAEKYKKKIRSKQTKKMPAAIFEKDRSALLNLIDSIQTLNGFLREVNARKLQYQKG